MVEGWSFNPPPGWPHPPRGWMPPPGWEPDPDWAPLPPGWQLWVPTPRRSWASVVCTAGAVGLVLAATLWLPRMSDAALLSGSDAQVDDGASGAGLPAQLGTLTPDLPPRDDAGATPLSAVSPLTAATAPRFHSCGALTAVYPHGVGLPDAVDRPGRYRDVKRTATAPGRGVRSGEGPGREPEPPDEPTAADRVQAPVVDFGRSTALYSANQPLDTDRDGIACER
ncbi:excalibur calcium-binding domain-containing protein [Kineosporia sp. J2-2]|uniref:Excalibur calcium-binding domain-containing protein n=1 Tax=Kineosporia corallincola TaxID=2835133 RepID=A0ABS5TDJ2_9ACTN|nr:excalibur calcium-binding domain-containing protein [Kineosporia corallincola]MBT0769152.1 excalibur calcium-binding domain-containing protein [Kineosporia corallincola]